MKKSNLSAYIKEFFTFKINNDCIDWNNGQIYFIRIFPKNMMILSHDEKMEVINGFKSFLDAAATKFTIFITDKTEDLSEINNFYKKQLALRPDYQFCLQPVISKISSIEQSSASVQRAFYIVFKAQDRREFDIFIKQLSEKFNCKTAEKEELILVFRNFILREYTPFDLYNFESAVKEHYKDYQKSKKRNQKAVENPYREQREDNISAIDRLTANDILKDSESMKEVNIDEQSKEMSVTGEHLWGHS